MCFSRTSIACATLLLLTTCASCRVEDLDPNGDGIIDKSEFLSAAFDAICGDAGSDLPNDEAPDDEAPTDETPTDEVPVEETPVDETPTNGATLDDLLDEQLPSSGP